MQAFAGLAIPSATHSPPMMHQPDAGSQRASAPTHTSQAMVQRGPDPPQTPAAQASVTVHQSRSSHVAPSGSSTGSHVPVIGSQTLTRQSVSPLGSQTTTVASSTTHSRAAQIRVPLHAFPSSCAAHSGVVSHSQWLGPGTHSRRELHLSSSVHGLPSSQGTPSAGGLEQARPPATVWQLSVEQGSPSSQSTIS